MGMMTEDRRTDLATDTKIPKGTQGAKTDTAADTMIGMRTDMVIDEVTVRTTDAVADVVTGMGTERIRMTDTERAGTEVRPRRKSPAAPSC